MIDSCNCLLNNVVNFNELQIVPHFESEIDCIKVNLNSVDGHETSHMIVHNHLRTADGREIHHGQ